LVPFLVRLIWKMPITRVQELLSDSDFVHDLETRVDEITRQLECQNRWKIVILFCDAMQIDAETLSRAAQRAFGDSFAVIDREIDPVDASFLPSERSDPVVTGIPPVMVCYWPPHLFGVYVVSSQYPDLVDDQNTEGDGIRHESINNHRACVEVEVLPYLDNMQPTENGYAYSGKLAAELMNDQCVGVYLPECDRFLPMSAELPSDLRSSDPASTLDL